MQCAISSAANGWRKDEPVGHSRRSVRDRTQSTRAAEYCSDGESQMRASNDPVGVSICTMDAEMTGDSSGAFSRSCELRNLRGR